MSTDHALSPAEARLIAAVAADPSASQADLATRLGWTDRHVRRLLAREPIRRALDEAAQQGLREVASLLGRAAVRAGRALVGMADGGVPATSPRVSAAAKVIELAIGLDERRVLEGRLVEVERQIAAMKSCSGPTGRYS